MVRVRDKARVRDKVRVRDKARVRDKVRIYIEEAFNENHPREEVQYLTGLGPIRVSVKVQGGGSISYWPGV